MVDYKWILLSHTTLGGPMISAFRGRRYINGVALPPRDRLLTPGNAATATPHEGELPAAPPSPAGLVGPDRAR